MAPLKRSRGGQAIAPKRNGPSARGRAGAVEVVFRGAQKHKQSIQRHRPWSKTPIRVSTSTAPGPVEADSTFEDSRLCAKCVQAGFCHEDLFMSDSVMPTGCAGGWPGPDAMVVLETRPCVGPPRRAGKCPDPESLSTMIAKIVTARG